MDKKRKFLVARRRNEQKRAGSSFISAFTDATGMSISEFSLLDPNYSIELDNRISNLTREGLRSGFVKRTCHMEKDEIEEKLNSSSFATLNDDIDLLFCNYEDFGIRCKLSVALKVVLRIIDFDQDAITIVHREGQNGLMIDVETEMEDVNLFELDVWGDWHL